MSTNGNEGCVSREGDNLLERAEHLGIKLTPEIRDLLAQPELTVWDIRLLRGGIDQLSKEAVNKALRSERIKGAYKKKVGGQDRWFAPTINVLDWLETKAPYQPGRNETKSLRLKQPAISPSLLEKREKVAALNRGKRPS